MDTKVPCHADKGIVHGGGQTKMSGQDRVERMSLLSAGENNRAKKLWKRCRKQSRELFPEAGLDG